MAKTELQKGEKLPPKSIKLFVRQFIDSIVSLEECAVTYIPNAEETIKKRVSDIAGQLTASLDEVMKHRTSKRKFAEKIRVHILPHAKTVERLSKNPPDQLLIKSFFLMTFSFFDAFVGNLLQFIFETKEELLNSIEKEIKFRELLKVDSLKDFKFEVINEFVENFKRESYVAQFKNLEKRFSVTFRDFSNWAKFVEVSQRRNLITHCDGIVNDQYLKNCSTEGYVVPGSIKKGSKLSVDRQYLFETFDLFKEVGLKLAQVLWRKNFPEFSNEADVQLNNYLYELLLEEKWALASLIGEFGAMVSERSSESNHRMIKINYAQALKWGGNNTKAQSVINESDWTSCSPEFKLAVSVLNGDIDEACETMWVIGKNSQTIDEIAYKDWPLFRELRQTEAFQKMYKKIYKKEFTTVVKNAVVKELKKAVSDSAESAKFKRSVTDTTQGDRQVKQ